MWCRSCGTYFDLPFTSSENYGGESIYCERCDGAQLEAEMQKVDTLATDAAMERFLDLVTEHGLFEAEAIVREQAFERDADNATLYAPDE